VAITFTPRQGDRVQSWQRISTRAMIWLDQHRAFFDPDAAPADARLLTLKALVELAWMLGLRTRMGSAATGESKRLFSLVRYVARRPSYRQHLYMDRRALLLYAPTYAGLRLHGYDDKELQHAIRQALSDRYATAFERIPYRRMDLLHTIEMCGFDYDAQEMEAALGQSLLAQDPNSVQLSDSDMYAITHAVFYATDFGRRQPEFLTRRLEGVQGLLDAMMVRALSTSNADLVGEVLICLHSLGLEESAACAEGWEHLHQVQDDDGRVAGPTDVVAPILRKLPPENAEWAKAYHTTIVTALAGGLAAHMASLSRTGSLAAHTATAPPPKFGSQAPGMLAAIPNSVERGVSWLEQEIVRLEPPSSFPTLICLLRSQPRSTVAHQMLGRAVGWIRQQTANRLLELPLWDLLTLAGHAEQAGFACPELKEFWIQVLRAAGKPRDVAANRDILMEVAATASELAASRETRVTTSREIEQLARRVELGHLAGLSQDLRQSEIFGILSLLPDMWRRYELPTIAKACSIFLETNSVSHRLLEDAIALLISQQDHDGGFGYELSPASPEHLEFRREATIASVTLLSRIRAVDIRMNGSIVHQDTREQDVTITGGT
jgi:hypothetical protein